MKTPFSNKRGVLDFILQRVTAVILAIYVLHVTVVLILNEGVTYATLKVYFSSPYVLVLTSLAILSAISHAWVGLWTVGGDYLGSNSETGTIPATRRLFNIVIGIALIAYVLWALFMIWTLG